jgi:predicted component of type VI protein secretion system
MPRKKAAKRELIDTGRDKRYVRRDELGRFKESDDVGRSLSQDIRKKAKKEVPAGQGDRGDQPRRKAKSS